MGRFMRLEDRVAVVTGGGRGIGREVALALAREGADVVVSARSAAGIEKVAGEVEVLGVRGLAIKADVRLVEDVKGMIGSAIGEFGRLDILVNNAGIALRKRLEDTSEEEWDAVLDTNLKGAFLCCREALPYLGIDGIIVNVSSGAGKRGIPGLSAYCASKFGLVGLTESLAQEVADRRIRVYAVCPGGVDTDMHRSISPGRFQPSLLRPEYVAKHIVELCLPGCEVPTGESVEIR